MSRRFSFRWCTATISIVLILVIGICFAFWRTNEAPVVLLRHNGAVLCLAFSPCGAMLASGGADNTVRLWDVRTRAQIALLNGHTASIHAISFAPDGDRLASGGADRTIRLWHIAHTNTQYDSLAEVAERGCITAVTFTPDANRLMVAGGPGDNFVKCVDIQTKRIQVLHQGDRIYGVTAMAYSPDYRTFAVVGSDSVVRFWDVSRQEQVASIRTHYTRDHEGITCVAFAPNSSTMATAGADKTIKIWDTASQTATKTLPAVTARITCLAYSQDPNILISAGGTSHDKPGVVTSWDIQSGRELRTVNGHNGPIQCIAVSPDGRTIVTGGMDGVMKWWHMDKLLK